MFAVHKELIHAYIMGLYKVETLSPVNLLIGIMHCKYIWHVICRDRARNSICTNLRT